MKHLICSLALCLAACGGADAGPIVKGSRTAGKSAPVSWVNLPTRNADGSAIGAIGDQKVYWDTISRMGTGVAYANSATVGDGTSLSKIITGLAANTPYYFATSTVVSGVESELSPEVTVTTAP